MTSSSSSHSPPHSSLGDDTMSMVRCEECGHELPAANLALHRAVTACGGAGHRRSPSTSVPHQPQQQPQQRLTLDRRTNDESGVAVNHHSTVNVYDTTLSTAPPTLETTMECPYCGKHVSTLSATVHTATCHNRHRHRRPIQSQQHSDNDDAMEEEEVALLEQPDSIETILGGGDPSQQPLQPPQGDDSIRNLTLQDTPEQQQEWSCPQCTLLNSLEQLHCEACGLVHHDPSTPLRAAHDSRSIHPDGTFATPPLGLTSINVNDNDDNGVRIEIHEVDPRLVRAVTGATSVVAWSLLGGLVAGPVGMAVGAATSAMLAGVQEWQQQQQPQNPNRPPRFTFTSTRFTESPNGGSVVQVTTNASGAGGAGNHGRVRTIVVRAPPGTHRHNNTPLPMRTTMTLTDRQILELLLHPNTLRMPAGRPIDPSAMTYDELLERFGVGTEHRRGASPETIQSLPTFQWDTNHGSDATTAQQTCCHICLEDFAVGDTLRQLPTCKHVFHPQCIDRWLTTVAACPVCKQEIQSVVPRVVATT